MIVKNYKLFLESISNKVDYHYDGNNHKDIRYTFLSLVQKTTPHGKENTLLKYLPELRKDLFGNYYTIIGKPSVMFTAHLDNADDKEHIVNVMSKKNENGDEIFYTDGSTILGADNKAGVSLLLNMISNNVTGLYYFFIGEELGAIGSRNLADSFNNVEHLKGIDKCVSFDRRNYHSVITHQMNRETCSDNFADYIISELNRNGLEYRKDSTGVFSDSGSFMNVIPECTNISTGVFDEHMTTEYLNISYLIKLSKAVVNINWNNIPVFRTI